MKHIFFILCFLLSMAGFAQGTYQYEEVKGDPTHAKIYTLDNGLKVYLIVNNDQPRIQTAIAVRTGGKNDPAETTGLAHYLEHIMFKGTQQFGTTDYEAEKPMLDRIEELYEEYRKTEGAAPRDSIYHIIDSISYEASKIAIANEYDKLMAGIGSTGSNAFTSEDETVYIENIPANEVENWAIVQSDRFKNMVIRGFHTELEAVYEEYNRSLTQDIRKTLEAMNQMLYKNHPYGQQTVIGTQQHLKNPSITNIKNYFHNYYSPDNIAICMSGNLSPDDVMDIIVKYFGDWQPKENRTRKLWPLEEPMKGIETKSVYGHESEMVVLGWRFPGKYSNDSELAQIIGELLNNGKAGLFDISLNQQQKVLDASVYVDAMSDYSSILCLGQPKEGQSLDEVKKLMLLEIDRLLKGDFDQQLLTSIINNMKKDEMKAMEDNMKSGMKLVDAFINNRPWKDEVEKISRLEKVTKKDIVDFANKYMSVNDYACVYKLQGDDPNEKKIDKPKISPIEMNRDKQSAFVQQVMGNFVDPITPEYVDFNTDIDTYRLKSGNTFMYKKNEKNGLFSLTYVVEHGSKADKFLPYAVQYFEYLGTKRLEVDKIKSELYALACDISFNVYEDQTWIRLSGLAENQTKAMAVLEDWVKNVKVDQDIYNNYVDDVMKARAMDKTNQRSCMARLNAYCMYGPLNVYTNIPSEEELRSITPAEMVQKVKDLANYKQINLYYGPTPMKDMQTSLNKIHKVAKDPIPAVADNYYPLQTVDANEVYLAHYDSKAINMAMYSNNGQKYSTELVPQIELFNEYFGGGMNTIVFQELRESRGLAYQASAMYQTPQRKAEPNYFRTYIISQNDKMGTCIDVFNDIIEEMPMSEPAFKLAKQNLKKRIESERQVGANTLFYILRSKRLGLDHDINEDIYGKLGRMRPADLEKFAKENVAGRTYRYIILGDENDLDMKKLRKMGPVKTLTLEQIFGY